MSRLSPKFLAPVGFGIALLVAAFTGSANAGPVAISALNAIKAPTSVAAVTASRPAATPGCDWNAPGSAPYAGTVNAAIDHYADIPLETRNRLKARVAAKQYDDMVTITGTSISGKSDYSELRDMHWARGLCKGAVNRSKWTNSMVERGLVFCESGTCLLIPTVCRNVARVTASPRKNGTDYPQYGASQGLNGESFDSKSRPDSLLASAQGVQSGGAPSATAPTPNASPYGVSFDPEITPSGEPTPLGAGIPMSLPTGGGGGFPVYYPVPAPTPTPKPPDAPVSSIPEPGTYALLLMGLGALAAYRQRRQSKQFREE